MRNAKSKEDLSKKLVIFDLDQTLVDVFPFHDRAIQKSLNEVFGIKGSLRDIDFTGKTISICLREICRVHGVNEKLVKKNLKKSIYLYKKYFSIPKNISKYILPGAMRLLTYNKSKGNFLALVTGTISGAAQKILKNAKIEKFFQIKFFGEQGKNKIELAKKAILASNKKSKSRFKKNHIFLIGDSVRDIMSARKNNASGIGVATGIHSAEKLKNAGAVLAVKTLKDKKILKYC